MFAERLTAAANAHDPNAFAACFASGYVSEQPAHPSRRFVGPDQVRTNWQTFIRDVPDLRAEAISSVATDDMEWIEWRWFGTRRDGAAFDVRGVMVLTIADGLITHGRLYLEPVDARPMDINSAVTTWTQGMQEFYEP